MNPVIVLAGAGILRTPGAVEAVRELAAEANVGVANTWNLKGLFRWDDPHHLGTVGLQERDLELLGVAEAREVVAIGVDDDELDLTALPNVASVRPADVAEIDLGHQDTIERPMLYERLAGALQPLYSSDKRPRSPARLLADVAATGENVVAAPGTLTGFWVARAFPTSVLGQVKFGRPPTIEWGPDDVDWRDTQVLIDVAGDIVAWGGVR